MARPPPTGSWPDATRGASTKRKASRSCARRSTWGSTSSTPPTSTRAAPARKCSDAFSSATPAASPWSSPPRFTASCATSPTAGAFPAKPSFTSSTRASAGWGWTMWISTRSTAGTTRRRSRKPSRRCTTWSNRAGCATSAPPPCTPGSSPGRSTSRIFIAGRVSSPCRTTTTCSIARRSEKCCRFAGRKASASFPGVPSRAAA